MAITKNVNPRVLLYILYRFGAVSQEIADRAPEIDIDYLLEDLPHMIDSMRVRCDRLSQHQHQFAYLLAQRQRHQ